MAIKKFHISPNKEKPKKLTTEEIAKKVFPPEAIRKFKDIANKMPLIRKKLS